ncbi:MAG TPA: tail fiber domain-containing protein [Ferruginibacter sp.]|nr:tail fiber domain-containing protein [Ferruginibacter sp.]
MKKIIVLLILLIGVNHLFAQNIGIGTSNPANKLHIIGNILVNEPTLATNTPPTPAQTVTLINSSTVIFPNTDSTGHLYDPGGAAGNYIANLTAFAQINFSTNTGIELDFTTMDLNVGDSLIIKESLSSTSPLFAVGNGYSVTGKIIVNTATLYLIFKSNADGNIGAGFSMRFRRLYSNASSFPAISGYSGNVMYYDTKRSAFRVGPLKNIVPGDYSLGTGYKTAATGIYSTAMGNESIASGPSSTALGSTTIATGSFATSMGFLTSAGGNGSTAMGYNTNASGDISTAMGQSSTASGYTSTAIGYFANASANYSTALGNYVSTNGQAGALIIGDNSTTTYLNCFVPNGFRARFAGGYGFFSNALATIGVQVAAGGNAWTTISDVRLKENFLPVSGEGVLKSIASMPQYTWNYKTQDPKTFRHYGPMAQDFYKAFGKDELGTIGCDTLINQHDFLGVSFIAIQALEKRTADLNDKLVTENKILKQELDDLKQKLQEIEKLIKKD